MLRSISINSSGNPWNQLLINSIHQKNFDSSKTKKKIQKTKTHAVNIEKHAYNN